MIGRRKGSIGKREEREVAGWRGEGRIVLDIEKEW